MLDISCKSSAWPYFLQKIKVKIIKVSSSAVLLGALINNVFWVFFHILLTGANERFAVWLSVCSYFDFGVFWHIYVKVIFSFKDNA